MNEKELNWFPVPGYEGYYEITKCGRIRGLERSIVRFSVRNGTCSVQVRPKELMPFKNTDGYMTVELRNGGKRKCLYMHRLLAKAFISNYEKKPCVNHIDGNKANNSIQNLEWCTFAENSKHAVDSGLLPKSSIGPGEASPAAKLNNQKVLEIKRALSDGATHAQLAKSYGVSKGAIGFIARGETWAHVQFSETVAA